MRTRLDNGAVVIAKYSGATPAVTVHASFEAGTVFDPASEHGVSHFVSRTIDRGTIALTADEIAERFDRRGVSQAITVNRHVLSMVCTCLVEDLDDTRDAGRSRDGAGVPDAKSRRAAASHDDSPG